MLLKIRAGGQQNLGLNQSQNIQSLDYITEIFLGVCLSGNGMHGGERWDSGGGART